LSIIFIFFVDAAPQISIKGNVRLILSSVGSEIVGCQLVMHPKVLIEYSNKQFIVNELKRLSTKPEHRVAEPSEFVFAFEIRHILVFYFYI
jgi:hypothetical protein